MKAWKLPFHFDLDFNDMSESEERYFYGKKNTKQLDELINRYFDIGIVPVIGDYLDVPGDMKTNSDSIRYIVKQREFTHAGLQFILLHYRK